MAGIEGIFDTSDCNNNIKIKLELVDALDELHEHISMVLLVEALALLRGIEGVVFQLLDQPLELI